MAFENRKNGRRGGAIVMASILFSGSGMARAEATSPALSNNAEAPSARDAAQQNATARFLAGRKRFEKGEYTAAVFEFEASNRALPSWTTLFALSNCLIRLKRYDEALDKLETLLRKYGGALPEGTKNVAQTNIDLLRKETGTVMVTGAIPGTWILIDGRWRGEHPLAAALPVLPGRHWVRFYKEGFSVYESEVEVPKSNLTTLDVKLTALPNAGRLKIGEESGKKMEVVVDGIPVGVTPWEGPVAPGEHSVFLRPATAHEEPNGAGCNTEENFRPPEDAGDPTSHEMGTTPQIVHIKPGQTTSLELKAERLGAVVHIMPTPPNAEVYTDGIPVSRGGYIGPAQPGKHVIKTKADGYFETTTEIVAAAGEENDPPIEMKKDVNAPKWTVAGRVLLEVRAGMPLANSLGSSLEAFCSTACQQGLALGVNTAFRGGYEWANGLGVGGTIGYFQVEQSHVGLDATLLVNGQNQNGKANDTTLLQNFMLGAYGSYKFGRNFPIRLGLGAGFMRGNVTYQRMGTFADQAVGPVEQSGSFSWFYIEPEARVGVQITERWSVGVALSGMLIIGPQAPTWTQKMKVNAHSNIEDQLGIFVAKPITGSAFFTMNQSLYLQFGF